MMNEIAHSLGGSTHENGLFYYVVARCASIDVILVALSHNLGWVKLRGCFGLEQEKIAEVVEYHEATRSFFQTHFSCAISKEKVIASREEVMIFFPEKAGHPQSQPLADWLKAVCVLLDPWTLIKPPLCDGCGVEDADRKFLEQVENRYCPACLEANLALLKEQEQAPLPDPEGPTGVLNDLNEAELRTQASRQAERLGSQPGRFWLEVLALLPLGQLALIGEAKMIRVVVALGVGLLTVLLVLHPDWMITLAHRRPVDCLGIAAFLGFLIWGVCSSAFPLLFGKPKAQKIHGRRLVRGDQASLFNWLDKISRRIKSPQVEEIYLTADTRVFARTARTGISLVLGAPLVEHFAPEELESLVARSLSHLQYPDRRSAWVRRSAASWSDLKARLQLSPFSSLEAFARWYLPKFLVRAQVITRQQELAADRLSCRGGEGRAQLGAALIKQAVITQLYEDSLDKSILPGQEEDIAMAGIIRQPVEGQQQILEDELARPLEWGDIHPSLAQNLENLGVTKFEPGNLQGGDSCGLFADYPSLRGDVYKDISRAYQVLSRSLALQLTRQRKLLRLLEEPREARLERGRLLQIGQCYCELSQEEAALEYLARGLATAPLSQSSGLLACEVLYINLCLETKDASRAARFLAEKLQEDDLEILKASWQVHRRLGGAEAVCERLLACPQLPFEEKLRFANWLKIRRGVSAPQAGS